MEMIKVEISIPVEYLATYQRLVAENRLTELTHVIDQLRAIKELHEAQDRTDFYGKYLALSTEDKAVVDEKIPPKIPQPKEIESAIQ